MRFLPLIVRNLFRKKIRTSLTILSVAVALFLFGLLSVIDLAFNAAIDVAGADRLIVTSRTSLMVLLRTKQQPAIERIDGVADVTHATWFGGVYQKENNFFPQFAVDPESYFRIYTEFIVPKDQFQSFLEDRQGALVGRRTADRFGFKIGDRIPIKGTFLRPPDGSPWEFNIRGIFDGQRPQDDTTPLVLQHKLIEETVPIWRGRVGWYVVQVADPASAERVATAIDALFANSADETKTQPEAAWMAGFVQQIGNIRLIVVLIGTIVLFTLLLVTGNTMAIAIRERTSELAVLKTVGFSDRTILALVLAESFLITVVGGFIGLVCIKMLTIVFPILVRSVPELQPLAGMLPVFYLPWSRILGGAALSAIVGVSAGFIPALGAMRLRIVDALRRV
jgi:putative ABC transport system permease protein